MKKIYTFVFALFAVTAFSQVKIGTNPQTINANAMLEIEGSKGLLMPRLELQSTTLAAPLSAHVAGMTVYNTATAGDVKPGFYYNDGTKWSKLVTTDDKAVKFFYMPSIAFDTSQDRTNQTKNLYTEYKNQFSLPTPGNNKKSTNAPADGIPYFENATDLYYYITDYDPLVFPRITIDDEGVMSYDVKATATACSLINIVFVIK